MHQRRQKHVHLPEPELWICPRRYGHLDRRPAESHEPTDEAEHIEGNALVGERGEAERFPLLPLLWLVI